MGTENWADDLLAALPEDERRDRDRDRDRKDEDQAPESEPGFMSDVVFKNKN